MRDTAGNFYGTTYNGGTVGSGTVFKLSASGQESVLYSFCVQNYCPDGANPEAAAGRYAGWLLAASQPEDHSQVPSFDVLMLGIGPEAHVASLFPGLPALHDERTVVAVHDSPKPPPLRLSLTLPSIQAAREVWADWR